MPENTANNVIHIIGRITSDFAFSHEVFGEGFYHFTVEAPRLSEVTDILPMTISERLFDRNQFPPGTVVYVSGQIRSYNSYVEAEHRNKLVLTIFVKELDLAVPEGQNPNEAYINGFICKAPIYRTTPFGREICDLLVAVNRSYNKSDYIPCIAWGRNARYAGSLNTGDNILILGRMQSRVYQKKHESGEVEDRTAYEVSITKLDAVMETGKDRSPD